MHRDDDENDHHERSTRKYQDYGGDAHEDAVLACLRCCSFDGILGPVADDKPGGIVQPDLADPFRGPVSQTMMPPATFCRQRTGRSRKPPR
jgi:hypothetical protein